MTEYEIIKDIKKDFFSLRNGIVANALKNLYPKDKIIFGMTVPQFVDLSKKYPKSLKLGMMLWEDKKIREARLFALFIIPYSEIDYFTSKNMILDVESIEEAEFLAFKLLRNLSFANQLFKELSSLDSLSHYPSHCVEMLKKNLEVKTK